MICKNLRLFAKFVFFFLLRHPLMLGSFLALLNETILNVAFSTLMIEMHITAGTVQWLATGYKLITRKN